MQFLFGLLAHHPAQLAAMPNFVQPETSVYTIPECLDRRMIAFAPDVDSNTIYPDCTAVQVANSIKAFSTIYSGVPFSVPVQNVLNLYATTVGVHATPEDLRATHGAVYAEVIKNVLAHGLQVNDQLMCVPNVCVLDNSIKQLATATDLYGCANIGIRLYERDMQIAASPEEILLDADGSETGRMVGRHMTMTWDYLSLAPTGVWRVNMWGRLLPVTTRWLQSRVDESWAHIYRNLVSPDNVAHYPHLVTDSGFAWGNNIDV